MQRAVPAVHGSPVFLGWTPFIEFAMNNSQDEKVKLKEEERLTLFILLCWMNDENDYKPEYFVFNNKSLLEMFHRLEAADEHDGDCTKEPHVCYACLFSKLKIARACANKALKKYREDLQ